MSSAGKQGKDLQQDTEFQMTVKEIESQHGSEQKRLIYIECTVIYWLNRKAIYMISHTVGLLLTAHIQHTTKEQQAILAQRHS